jgi:ElaB/YqjD/DUF883 family membrane-anchored ribosome-binding protein
MAELTGSKQTGSNPAGASAHSSASLGSAHSLTGDMTESMKEAYVTVQKKAQEAVVTSEDFIRARPIRVVLGAAAVGFLAGFLSRRKH